MRSLSLKTRLDFASVLRPFSSHGIFRTPDLYTTRPRPRLLPASYLVWPSDLDRVLSRFLDMYAIYTYAELSELLRRSSWKTPLGHGFNILKRHDLGGFRKQASVGLKDNCFKDSCIHFQNSVVFWLISSPSLPSPFLTCHSPTSSAPVPKPRRHTSPYRTTRINCSMNLYRR
jgi:hypothetical protein